VEILALIVKGKREGTRGKMSLLLKDGGYSGKVIEKGQKQKKNQLAMNNEASDRIREGGEGLFATGLEKKNGSVRSRR